MVLYRDSEGQPTHVAIVAPSEWADASKWAARRGFRLGGDIHRPHRAYLARVWQYCRGLTALEVHSLGPDLPCAHVWEVFPLIPIEGHQLSLPGV